MTTTAINQVPDRSLAQRLDALQRANDVRVARAALKRDIKAGRVQVGYVIARPPDYAEAMTVYDLLRAAPKIGTVKTSRALAACGISRSRTLRGLTRGQRDGLIAYLAER